MCSNSSGSVAARKRSAALAHVARRCRRHLLQARLPRLTRPPQALAPEISRQQQKGGPRNPCRERRAPNKKSSQIWLQVGSSITTGNLRSFSSTPLGVVIWCSPSDILACDVRCSVAAGLPLLVLLGRALLLLLTVAALLAVVVSLRSRDGFWSVVVCLTRTQICPCLCVCSGGGAQLWAFRFLPVISVTRCLVAPILQLCFNTAHKPARIPH